MEWFLLGKIAASCGFSCIHPYHLSCLNERALQICPVMARICFFYFFISDITWFFSTVISKNMHNVWTYEWFLNENKVKLYKLYIDIYYTIADWILLNQHGDGDTVVTQVSSLLQFLDADVSFPFDTCPAWCDLLALQAGQRQQGCCEGSSHAMSDL